MVPGLRFFGFRVKGFGFRPGFRTTSINPAKLLRGALLIMTSLQSLGVERGLGAKCLGLLEFRDSVYLMLQRTPSLSGLGRLALLEAERPFWVTHAEMKHCTANLLECYNILPDRYRNMY